MRNILDFILKHSHWALFILLQAIAAFLLFRFNSFQGSVWFTSASTVAASINKTSSAVTRYFGLEEMNRDLTARNVQLMEELKYYKELVGQYIPNDSTPKLIQGVEKTVKQDSVVMTVREPLKDISKDQLVCEAKVINISVSRYDNYVTIDKGEKHGIKSGMGVISGVGVVGIVSRTSSNYALVLPVLNSKSSISCKIARTDYFGFLKWEGGDPLKASMTDVPRHAEYEVGDTIVTSGHSTVFFEGIPVGTIVSKDESLDDMSFTFGVKLFTDFGKLKDVYVLALPPHEELNELEKDINF